MVNFVNRFILGIANVLSRVIVGLVADWKCMNTNIVFKSTLILAGISTAVSPFLEGFETKLLYACLFGVFMGENIAFIKF